jgi:hypothetical protein
MRNASMSAVVSRAAFIAFVLVSTTAIEAAGPALTLEVDARDVTQGIQHAHLAIPVHAGDVSLAYPNGFRESMPRPAR